MLAKAGMSLAVILAQFPVGGDQMHTDHPDATPVASGDWNVIIVLLAVPAIGLLLLWIIELVVPNNVAWVRKFFSKKEKS